MREPAWLDTRRSRARELAATLGLPQFKGKPGWEFTSLDGLDLDVYEPAVPGDGVASAAATVTRAFSDLEGAHTIVQVDGRTLGEPYEPASSEGPLVLPLTLAVEHHPDLVERHFGKVVALEDSDVFVARNEAAWTGGLFVHVPRNTRLDAPVLATLIADAGRSIGWRVLIALEEGAQAEVWEELVSADEETPSLVNTVVELSVGQNATLRYISGQSLNERSWVFGTQRAVIDRDGRLDWVALGFGSAKGKVRTETVLAGEGANAQVTGAYAPHARQHVDFDTTQEHAARNTTSDLAFRGVLSGRSSAVWRGMIKVDPGAQQTDAFQECRNLLLSKRAHADAIPGLEILADDVRCTHAAAIAQIDTEQLFYLRSRGLRLEQARRLVIEGFLAELVERFEEGPVRTVLAGALERRLGAVLGG